MNTTESGRVCQRWSSDTPHRVLSGDTDNEFPDGSREAAENYCRNPDAEWNEGVWCYTTDVDKRWEACNVPECGESVLLWPRQLGQAIIFCRRGFFFLSFFFCLFPRLFSAVGDWMSAILAHMMWL